MSVNGTRYRKSAFWLALIAAVAMVATGPAGALSRGLLVKPAKTRIGIARVILQIDELSLTNSGLIGEYAIRIPLAPFMDDHGSIRINMDQTLAEAVQPGNTLTGSASSLEDGRVHGITCTFLNGERLSIVVTTNERVLNFEAPYSLHL